MQQIEAIGPSRARKHTAGAWERESSGEATLEGDHQSMVPLRSSVFVWSDGHSVERLRTLAEGLGGVP